MNKTEKRSALPLFCCLACIILLFVTVMVFVFATDTKWRTGEDFGIETLLSKCDFDGDGTDDYTDILLGARADAQNKPVYDGSYQTNAYPPDNIGVCTDVVWRAFRNAGYSLRLMVDADVRKNASLYPDMKAPDSNIDFRRVKNLSVFFGRFAENLTTDITDIAAWQPGDIVIFENRHIGIVSDRREADGKPYIIHNGGQKNREEPFLSEMTVYGHYRFDASRLPDGFAIEFEG